MGGWRDKEGKTGGVGEIWKEVDTKYVLIKTSSSSLPTHAGLDESSA